MNEETLLAVLRRTRDFIAERAGPEAMYGYYPGGDPRGFSPDEESSTVEERAAHKTACEAWERGECPDPGGPHKPFEGGHLTVSHYGLGVYTYTDEEAEDVLEQLDAAINGLEGEEEAS